MLKGPSLKEQIADWREQKVIDNAKQPWKNMRGADGSELSEDDQLVAYFWYTCHWLDLEKESLRWNYRFDTDTGRPYDAVRGAPYMYDHDRQEAYDFFSGRPVDLVALGVALPEKPTPAQAAAFDKLFDRLLLFKRVEQAAFNMHDCFLNANNEGRPPIEGIREGIKIFFQEDLARMYIFGKTLKNQEHGTDLMTAWVAANTRMDGRLKKALSAEYADSMGRMNASDALLTELYGRVGETLGDGLNKLRTGQYADLSPATIRTKVTEEIRTELGTDSQIADSPFEHFEAAFSYEEDGLSKVLADEDAAEREEQMRAQVAEAHTRLTPNQFNIMELTAEGYTQKQIAEMTGKAEGTIAATISQVREKMNTPLANRKKKGRPKK